MIPLDVTPDVQKQIISELEILFQVKLYCTLFYYSTSILLFDTNYCPFLTAIFFSALHHSLLNSMEHFLLKIGMVSFQSN